MVAWPNGDGKETMGTFRRQNSNNSDCQLSGLGNSLRNKALEKYKFSMT